MRNIKIGDCFDSGSSRPFVCLRVGTLWPYIDELGEPILLNPNVYPPMTTLHMPIGNDPKKYGGAWFDLIRSGVKKEEYREVNDFYSIQLTTNWKRWMPGIDAFHHPKTFKVLHLTNGYGHDKPQLWAHIESITIGRGNPDWGAPVDRDVFIIRLGDVFHTKNLKK